MDLGAIALGNARADKDLCVLTDIYREDTNMAVYQRSLSKALRDSSRKLLESNKQCQLILAVTPGNALFLLNQSLKAPPQSAILYKDIAEPVAMFCCLFDLKRAGLRLVALDRAMCPKFHVDRVPCRLITTYLGTATQWLPNSAVNREHLQSDRGLPTANPQNIQQLRAGDVALLKGELWQGNENRGVVHRSPDLAAGGSRLLLTLDFID